MRLDNAGQVFLQLAVILHIALICKLKILTLMGKGFKHLNQDWIKLFKNIFKHFTCHPFNL